MAMTKCPRGHYYDDVKYNQCPHCRIIATVGGGADRDERTVAMRKLSDGSDETVSFTAPVEDDSLDRTVGLRSPKSGRGGLPVGWLVCVEGPERGRDHRLMAGRSFAGRSLGMDVCLGADKEIHRSNQFSVVFDPQSGVFSLLSGDGSLTYLNDVPLTEPAELKDWDVIRAGKTLLVFRSFCGEGFKW